jgi:hypothetical protein
VKTGIGVTSTLAVGRALGVLDGELAGGVGEAIAAADAVAVLPGLAVAPVPAQPPPSAATTTTPTATATRMGSVSTVP